MARSRKKKSANDKKTCTGPSESNSVRGGKPLCNTTCGVAMEDILVPEKCGFAAGSCSSAHNNNRPTLTDVVQKTCLSSPLWNADSTPNYNNQASTTRRIIFHVNNSIYHVDVLKEKVYRFRTCIFHSIKMWKDTPRKTANKSIEKGKKPRHMYARSQDDNHESCSAWIYCNRCGRAGCILCAVAILDKVESDDAAKEEYIKKDNWLQCVKKLSCQKVQCGHVLVLRVPPTDSHCCRLGKCVRVDRNKRKRARRSELKKLCNRKDNHKVQDISNDVCGASPRSNRGRSVVSNDGYLHYAPYRAVFKPSCRYYESLCAAQQGKKGSTNFQDAVYHSVISNELAKTYDTMGVYPEGDYSQVIASQKFFFVSLPSKFGGSKYLAKDVLVRRVLLKFSSDYFSHPTNGSCPLSDPTYFNGCCKFMDRAWEDEDVQNGVFCCLVTGQAGPNDIGRNEILLCCRIYDSAYMIPDINSTRLDAFLQDCFARAGKSGFENRRLGGSAGSSEATTEQLRYFSKYRACYPILAGSVFHLPLTSGRWRSYYISPYKGPNIQQAAAMHHYSSPKPGGAIEWKLELDVLYPKFFENMSKNRYMAALIMDLLDAQHHISISPVARRVQLQYNQIAEVISYKTRTSEYIEMSDQVVYSLVPYTVGLHRDVTKSGVSQELVECKACLVWPMKSIDGQKLPMALGRGGAGYGKFTIMIVDHPKKKSA